MGLKHLVLALAGATAGFLAGELSAVFVLKLILVPRGAQTDLTWVWLLWIVPPVAGAVAGAFVFRCTESTKIWHWLVLAVPVPVGAYIFVRIYFAVHGLRTPGLILGSLVQLVISVVITLAVGMFRVRRRRNLSPSW